MDVLHRQLFEALERMVRLHKLMMSKVDHRASFYDAECLDEMNSAPIKPSKSSSKG